MRRRTTLVAVALVVTGCGGSEKPEAAVTPTPTPTTSSPTITTSPTLSPTSGPGTTVIVADSDYGPMLYDATGQPIYLFDAETTTTPECYGECAEAWPPVFTNGTPQARKGTRAGLLGTTKRRDGRTQVTYAGHPLYFYAHEGKYQVRCHDVVEYGGTWLVVRPDGTPAP